MEIWRTIPEFTDYEASNLGNIRRSQGPGVPAPRLRKAMENPDTGYLEVLFSVRCHKTCRKVHRMVYSAFAPLDSTKVINHIDGNKKNNRLENLEAVTQGQNLLHAYRVLNRRRPGAEHVVRDPATGRILGMRAYMTGEYGRRG